MSEERSRRPEPRANPDAVARGDSRAAEAAARLAVHAAAQVVCPYCKGPLAEAAPGVACEGCGTFHHPTCFAEHGSCAVHACGSTRGDARRVGAPAPTGFEPRSCAHCGEPCGADALVGRCACGRVVDLGCYERLGHCGLDSCRRVVRVMPHADAAQVHHLGRSRRLLALGLAGLGLAFAVVASPLVPRAFGIIPSLSPQDLLLVLCTALSLFGLALVPLSLSFAERRRAPSAGAERRPVPPPDPKACGREADPPG